MLVNGKVRTQPCPALSSENFRSPAFLDPWLTVSDVRNSCVRNGSKAPVFLSELVSLAKATVCPCGLTNDIPLTFLATNCNTGVVFAVVRSRLRRWKDTANGFPAWRSTRRASSSAQPGTSSLPQQLDPFQRLAVGLWFLSYFHTRDYQLTVGLWFLSYFHTKEDQLVLVRRV